MMTLVPMTAKAYARYLLWALPVAILMLWPLGLYLGKMHQLGEFGPAVALPVAAFAVAVAIAVIAAPIMAYGGTVRVVSSISGLFVALVGAVLVALSWLYFDSGTLTGATLINTSLGVVLLAWNIRFRKEASTAPISMVAITVLAIVTTGLLCYLMLPEWLRPFAGDT